jgi:hypothetical protein
LVAVPLLIGFVISRMVAQPLWSYAEGMDRNAFAPSDVQKVEGAHELHVEELRLRMVSGCTPPPESMGGCVCFAAADFLCLFAWFSSGVWAGGWVGWGSGL